MRSVAASVLRAVTSCPNGLHNFCSTDVPNHPTAAPSILDYQWDRVRECNWRAQFLTDISNGSIDPHTHYYGLVSDSGGQVANDKGFMRGCSDQPSTPDPSATGSGPAGNGWPGDPHASYADWYGGHELGHTFGRKHPGICKYETKDDPNYPFPDGTISDIQGSFVGLDFGDAGVDTNSGALITATPPPAGSTPVPRTVLPGPSTTEIMTYCAEPQWLSSYTFEEIRQRMIDEDSKISGKTEQQASSGVTRGVHVVASVDLTTMTGVIKYVFPITRIEPQPSAEQTAELVVRIIRDIASTWTCALLAREPIWF